MNLPEVDILAIGDTSLNTTTPVGHGSQPPSPRLLIDALHERIVVKTTRESGSTKTRADFERLSRGNRKHGVGKDSFELVETGLTQTKGASTDNTGDGTTQGIILGLGSSDSLLHLFASLLVRASGDLLVNFLPSNSLHKVHVGFAQNLILFVGERQSGLADTGNKGNNLDAKSLLQVFLRNRASRNSSDSLTRGRTTTARRGLDTVLGKVGVVGMGRSGVKVSLGVVMRSLVLVVDKKADRGTKSNAVLGTRLNMNSVELGSLQSWLVYIQNISKENKTNSSSNVALSRSSPRQLRLDVGFCQLKSLE